MKLYFFLFSDFFCPIFLIHNFLKISIFQFFSNFFLVSYSNPLTFPNSPNNSKWKFPIRHTWDPETNWFDWCILRDLSAKINRNRKERSEWNWLMDGNFHQNSQQLILPSWRLVQIHPFSCHVDDRLLKEKLFRIPKLSGIIFRNKRKLELQKIKLELKKKISKKIY